MIEVIIINDKIYVADDNPTLGNSKYKHLQFGDGEIFGVDSIYTGEDGEDAHKNIIFSSTETMKEFIADAMAGELFDEEPVIGDHPDFITGKDSMIINLVPEECNEFIMEMIKIINGNEDYKYYVVENQMFSNVIVQIADFIKEKNSKNVASTVLDMLFSFTRMFDNILSIIGDNITPEAADEVLKNLGSMLSGGNEYEDGNTEAE